MNLWREESGLPSAWLSLDADDNDPVRFLRYLTGTLKELSPEIGQVTQALLHTSQAPSLDAILTTLINELSALSHPFLLFLDDYHWIESQEIHAGLAYLIEHLPHRMSLFLASRSDPPLPFSRLRAQGQLTEIRQADLRFTPEEAAQFLNSVRLDLTAEQVAALESRTEGWIAGLQLAALSLRGKEDLASFVESFSGSHRFVFDYLADEAFSGQPPEVRQFLLDTSLLDKFTASLCNAVTGRDDAVALLGKLEEQNVFLVPLDDHREWYRYHHLYRDFLVSKAGGYDRTDQYLQAVDWFMSRGLPSEAVHYALAAREMERIVPVLSQAAAEAFNRGAFQTVLGWLDELPEEVVRGNAELATSKGFALFLTQASEFAKPYVEAAEDSLLPETPPAARGRFLSLKAHLALCENQLDACISLSREALELLDDRDHLFRNLNLNALGQVLEMKEDVGSAADYYRQAYESGWQAGDQLGALVAFTNLIFSLNELGRRREAVAWCQKALAGDGVQQSRAALLLDAVYLGRGLLAYEANDLPGARDDIQRALDLLTALDFSPGILWGWNVLARIDLAEGKVEQVRAITAKGKHLAAKMGLDSFHGTWFAALEAQASLECGDLDAARDWAERIAFTPGDSPQYWAEHPYFVYTRILLAQDRLAEAMTLLNKLDLSASRQSRYRKLVSIHLLQAMILSAQGETVRSVERVEKALAFATPEEYRRAFLDEGQAIIPLLKKARPAAPAFVDEVLLAFRLPGVPSSPQMGLIEPLTEREQDVLRLVARGLSNREIAEALVVTLGTVKKHLNNIFQKMNVESRTQAIAKGREIGIIK